MSEPESTPHIGYMRLNEVLRLIPVSRATWYRGVKKGHFPKPVKLGSNTPGWRAADIVALCEHLDRESGIA